MIPTSYQSILQVSLVFTQKALVDRKVKYRMAMQLFVIHIYGRTTPS